MSTAAVPVADQIKAVANTADLLAAIERFEAVGCEFGAVTRAYIRAVKQDSQCGTFVYQGVQFETAGLSAMLLILSHAVKPKTDGPGQTLRPFAELLVTQNINQVRLVSLNHWHAHLEVLRVKNWVKLVEKGENNG